MLKKHHQLFASLLWAIDMLVVLGSFALAYQLRFYWQGVLPPPRWGESPVEETRALVLSIVVIWTVVFRFSGLYAPRRTAGLVDESFLIARSTFIGVLCLVALFYFFRDDRYSRLTIGLFAGVSVVSLSSARALARRLLRALRRRGLNLRHAVVVGTGDLARSVVEMLDQSPELGINVVGLLGEGQEEIGGRISDHEVIGRYGDVQSLVRSRRIDQVYVALPLDQPRRLVAVLAALDEEIVDIKVVPDLLQYYTLRGGVEELHGVPIVHLQNGPAVGWDAVTKRAFDMLLGTAALLIATPFMLATIFLVRLSSRGPIFYRQERMGLDGRLFQMMKFRTMRVDAEQRTGAVWASADDDRTTPIGRWLRRLSLDELPQLFNVLGGDMSLVGPRPERPVFIEKFEKQIPHYNLRHKVKAGITGLAQVEGWRGQTSLQKRIERDLYYIEHWSLWLDLKILVRTALGGFLSRNAY